MPTIPEQLQIIRRTAALSQEGLAQVLGVSFVSVNRWERAAAEPSPAQAERVRALYERARSCGDEQLSIAAYDSVFASRGIRGGKALTGPRQVILREGPGPPVLRRIVEDEFFNPGGRAYFEEVLRRHEVAAPTADERPERGMSAGKNTYTYDAHTYHTKVPPQGIAELLRHYLPEGVGLVLDPFAGSGMTGVAAATLGYDSILVELAPSACFISREFTTRIDPQLFEAAVDVILAECDAVRRRLYTTTCRECKNSAELLYTVWSYRVLCGHCSHEFQLWDHCRRYGRTVREHKILSEFPCPACGEHLQKSKLERTIAEPVQIGYKCCGSRQKEVTHPPDRDDLQLITELGNDPPTVTGFVPDVRIPEGVNLGQPRRHGFDHIQKLYTPRNLSALSHIWAVIHRLEDRELAAATAFVFTSLYRRVTRLSEFRFWGGSGNTARLNVPFIFDEPNVFRTFARKARTIQDHLETTATHYERQPVVINRTSTDLSLIPDGAVDLVFTDPPFGANINYSEMNLLWEAWLGMFTDSRHEAIINRVQGKGHDEYEQLMTVVLKETHRVLRSGGWLLLAFMNSSARVWASLMQALDDAGFSVLGADIFDKQHGTFKHFVSPNCAGADLILHCRKPLSSQLAMKKSSEIDVEDFLAQRKLIGIREEVFLHVSRESEVDFRRLYSEWLSVALPSGGAPMDFATFRSRAVAVLDKS